MTYTVKVALDEEAGDDLFYLRQHLKTKQNTKPISMALGVMAELARMMAEGYKMSLEKDGIRISFVPIEDVSDSVLSIPDSTAIKALEQAIELMYKGSNDDSVDD